MNQQVASWNHIRYQFPDTDKIHRYTNTQPCCFRPKGLSALGKDRVYFLPVTAKVLFSLCICVCSMRLSSTTGCIAMASRAEENCPIQAQRTHQYGNQFIGAILIWQDVCRNHHPLLWQTSLIHGHNSPCVVQSDPKISFPVIFFSFEVWNYGLQHKWPRVQSGSLWVLFLFNFHQLARNSVWRNVASLYPPALQQLKVWLHSLTFPER